MEECGDFGVFLSLLSVELHIRVRSLVMDGDLPAVRLCPSFDRRYRFALAFQCHGCEVGQSASCSRRYARFTEEWSVCLARGSCRGDEGLSIDNTTLVSIDSDARMWAKHISRPFKTQKPHEVTKIPLDDHYLLYTSPSPRDA